MIDILYWLPAGVPDLARASEGASGYDLRALLPDVDAWPLWRHDDGDPRLTLSPGTRSRVPTGLYLAMPFGVEAQVRGRSGLAFKHGIVEFPGTIDSDYRGEIAALLFNLGSYSFEIATGDRIAQLVFAPVIVPDVGNEIWMRHEETGCGVTPDLIIHPCIQLRRVASVADLPDSDRGADGFGSTGGK